MTPAARRTPAPKPRSVRSDGAATRERILDAAARIYAEKGWQRTTSREICAASGSNVAAVNYHFGSKDGLYEALLVQAHGQLVALNDLEAIRRSAAGPEDKLRALIALLVQRATADELPWGLQVLVHELMVARTRHVAALLKKAVLPKVRVITAIVADVLGAAPEQPVVQRALALIVLPCIMMVIAPREVLRRVVPALAADPQALADDMAHYALAGLQALARQHQVGAGRSQPKARR